MDIEQITQLPNYPEACLRNFDKTSPLVLFGAGGGCLTALKMFTQWGIRPVGISDNNSCKWGSNIEQLPVLSLDELITSYPHSSIFVSAPANAHEILPDLRSRLKFNPVLFFDDPYRINREEFKTYLHENKEGLNGLYKTLGDELSRTTMNNMLSAWASGSFTFYETIYRPDQYFPKDVISLGSEETFLDVGAYTGDSIEAFLRAVNHSYRGIVAFEPNPECQNALKTIQTQQHGMQIHPVGAYNRQGKFKFTIDSIASASKFVPIPDKNGIDVDLIDSLIKDPVSFIKMDIEGLEQEALQGAALCIKKYRPKLAICVYHLHNDLLEIARFIQSLEMNYQLFLRHHSFYTGETVLYAL